MGSETDAAPAPAPAWADRAADRSPAVQRSRRRTMTQARVMVEAARRLIQDKGASFTTQELAKEAGVALQTFYRHFASKDQLLLAVIEDVIAEQAKRFETEAARLPDPVARLRFYVTIALDSLRVEAGNMGPRFMTAEHWRLHQLFPDEMTAINQPFADLIERELRRAADAGLLQPGDPAKTAWLAMKLVMSVFHHYAFATATEDADELAEDLWQFFLRAFGGRPAGPLSPGRR